VKDRMNVKLTFQNQQGKGNLKNTKNPSNSSGYKPIKKTLADYMYYLGSAKQAADYDNRTEYLTKYINTTFIFGHDIASLLETLTGYDMEKHKQSLRASTSEDEMVAEIENKQFQIEFKAEFDSYMKKKQYLETNTSKANAILWEQCNRGMHTKIELHADFKTA
jgi:hypothetical protein